MSTPFQLRALGGVGVEVIGVDLETGIDGSTLDTLHKLLLDREVLLFRDQNLTDRGMVAFVGGFGTMQGHPLGKFSPPGFPQVLISSNGMKDGRPIGIVDIGQFWHTDGSYLPAPYMYTALYGVEIPHDANGNALGDTMFLSAHAAYEALPTSIKTSIEHRRALHSYDYRYNERLKSNAKVLSAAGNREDVWHPMVVRHPVTGKKSLFVNEGYVTQVEGMPPDEAKELLATLFAHLRLEQFGYRHRWRRGDLLLWDNYLTQHNAIPDYKLPQLRLMKRITLTKSVYQTQASGSA